MEPRGRAKARGRARSVAQEQPQAPGQRPAAPSGQRQPAAPGQAWGPRPGQSQPPAAAPGQVTWARPPPQQPMPQGQQPPQWSARPPVPTTVPQQPTSAGRGSRQGGGDEPTVSHSGVAGSSSRPGGKGDGEKRGAGNGGVRGRTNRNEIIQLRPTHVKTKKGTEGTMLKVKANYFEFIQVGKWSLYHYHVDFNPPIDLTPQRKKLLRTALQDRVNGYLFDGMAMYTPAVIQPDPLELFVQTESGENIRITIRMVGDVAWGDWHYIQLFNIVLKKCLAYMKLELLGRNYFDVASKVTIAEHNLELWPGYFTSIKQCEQKILLNTDLTNKVVRKDSVFNIMVDCRGRDPRQEFIQKIVGSIVLTDYNRKTYRIDDVDYKSTPESSFEKRDGSRITYQQYFKEKYNLDIHNLKQPMLVSRSKPREIRAGLPELVYLVPSLCIMTGLTDRQRENFQLMKSLAEHTRIGPQARMEKLLQFCRRLQGAPEAVAELRRWDLQLANDLITFDARILPEEMLFARNQQYPAGENADWTQKLRSNPMFNAQPLTALAVLCPQRVKQNAQEFVQLLQKAARGMSWNIEKTRIFDLPDDRTQTYLDMLEQVITRDNPTLVMCVLMNNSGDRYNAIKKKCSVDRPRPSQVILAKNLSSKGVMSIATKVAIQLNCKIGGAPWGTSVPKNTMVVGYDVCRDTANRKKSFSGMVASMDQACTRYFSHAVEHDVEQELSPHIGSFLVLACQKFREINGVYPERIIFYRDGVGDGQVNYVKQFEVEAIKKKLSEDIYNTPQQTLKLAYIVVSKRINTRVFKAQASGPQPNYNPPPGTVVDDVITLPERYDFFLISQCVRQGTVTPTNYNILEDTIMAGPNRLQRFSYKMCHMYYNWSGTVRVPAPCQYAHKLAFLTSQSLHRPAHTGLATVLHYL